jgi:hypothetical protein
MKLHALTALIGIGLVASSLATTPLLSAHHGSSRYDTSKGLELKGTILRVQWANPHTHVYLDVKDEKGVSVIWAVELPPPNYLVRLGITQAKLKMGEVFSVVASPLRAGTQADYQGAPTETRDRNAYYQRIISLGSESFSPATP